MPHSQVVLVTASSQHGSETTACYTTHGPTQVEHALRRRRPAPDAQWGQER